MARAVQLITGVLVPALCADAELIELCRELCDGKELRVQAGVDDRKVPGDRDCPCIVLLPGGWAPVTEVVEEAAGYRRPQVIVEVRVLDDRYAEERQGDQDGEGGAVVRTYKAPGIAEQLADAAEKTVLAALEEAGVDSYGITEVVEAETFFPLVFVRRTYTCDPREFDANQD